MTAATISATLRTRRLSPLVIASVGLLAGSLPGAVMGFGVGLFLDLALVQTVGLSSLLYLTVGYGAGRLRELRDPQGAVVPIAVGRKRWRRLVFFRGPVFTPRFYAGSRSGARSRRCLQNRKRCMWPRERRDG